MATGHKTGGRLRGTPNKLTRAFREAVQVAYEGVGGDNAFIAWARENQTEFYRIAARLIPLQVNGPNDGRPLPVLNIVLLTEPTRFAEREVRSDSPPALSAP